MQSSVLLRKVARSLRHRGVAGTAQVALSFAKLRVKSLSPARRRARLLDAAREAAFDEARGVDTAGRLAIAELEGIVGAHADAGERYQAVEPELLRALLAQLGIDHARYAFVDLGCGKGRPLLVAAELPFRQVVGIEFAPTLVQVAADNIARDRGLRRCPDVRAELGDAAVAPLPELPLVVFMHNPFGAQVMRPVLERLRGLACARTGELQILYMNPLLAGLVEAHGFARVDGGPGWVRYGCAAGAGGA